MKVTYPDGSSEETPAKVTVVPNDAQDNTPGYEEGRSASLSKSKSTSLSNSVSAEKSTSLSRSASVAKSQSISRSQSVVKYQKRLVCHIKLCKI
ncbi:hypothetical protein QS413_12810 [Staphylococcus pseudintermedius]|uniref:hypothetical protein n=1 Tax=Staphylococcus pseudintermedius TaxID=283734 RepID=UPI00286DDDDD|nr:hypothetical protein [Staphylococcus pseudintermedius]WMZ50342.1 hypothetical protein QS413_12810 [Staphylococcus pseudintermedius]